MEAGFGRRRIEVFEPGMPMLGWGVPENVAERFDAPLFVRAMALRHEGEAVVYALADLCFVSASLRVGVLEALRPRGLAPRQVALTATHTHRGPNGFSHAFFYDLSALGFSPRVYAHLVDAFAGAIGDALDRFAPASLHVGETRVPPREPVAFNRSPAAFLNNPEAKREPMVDRRLLALEARDPSGRPLGQLSFFATHATSMHSDATGLHPDHKGLAAALAEDGDDDYVALFAQGAAGDVTPSFRFDPARGFMVGARDDDEDSARLVAEVQHAGARHALRTATRLEGPLRSRLRRVDFELAAGPARLGLAMAAGTAEGPGPLYPVRRWLRGGGSEPRGTGRRDLLLVGPGRRRRLLGRFDPARIPLSHPAFAHARRADVDGALERHPWIPTVLPLQILELGELAIVLLPNEPTTQAARRIARRLGPRLGARRVLVQGYANAYAGYLTTPEEYAAQRYEGAYTLFGSGTLDAFIGALEELADGDQGGPPLQIVTGRDLEARLWR